MYKLNIPGLPLPDCMVAENRQEAQMCRDNYLPYIIRPKGWDDRKLIGAIMFHFLKQKFPYIRWEQVLGLKSSNVNKVLVMTTDTEDHDRITRRDTADIYVEDKVNLLQDGDTFEHCIDGGEGYIWGTDDEYIEEEEPEYIKCKMGDFFSSAVEHVNMEQLQALGLLPTFLADINEAIKRNVIGTAWMDGWNKKLQTSVGEYKYGEEAPNLIVLDVSGSIPEGVSYTMTTLIDMLRTQANADLIITGSRSYYYDHDIALPTPEELASLVGGCNEASMFNHILEDRVFGRHWGNVIVFGDMHAPTDSRFCTEYQITKDRRNTVIDHCLFYDTRGDFVPGYGLWTLDFVKDSGVEIMGSDWIHYMKGYRS